MKRSIKNIIMIICIIGIIISMFITFKYVTNNTSTNNEVTNQSSMENPPDMDNNESSNTSSYSNTQKPPSKPGDNNTNSNDNTKPDMNNNTQTPPSKPEDSTTNSNDNTKTDMDKSESNSSNGSDMSNQTDTIDSSNSNNNTPPEKPDDNNNQMPNINNTNNNINTVYYVVFGIESFILASILMYLIMSRFNKKKFKETFNSNDKVIIYLLSIIIITSGLTYLDGKLAKSKFSTTSISTTNNIKTSGKKEVTSKETIEEDIKTTTKDENGIVVKDGGKATIKNINVTKSGDTSSTENSDFYGVNAGILVSKNSSADISNINVKTNAKGGNGVFASGENAQVTINNSTIETTGESSSRGLDATYGGSIKANNVKITTQGNSSATLATDRGEGTVKVSNSKLETSGSGSPIIYSTGNISIKKTKGIANNSQMVVIEGKNKATVTSSNLTATGTGNRGDVDSSGIMIYQSMSGDSEEGTGTFTSKNSSLNLTSKTAPMFFVTNTSAIINLENTKLSYKSNILLSIKGTSEWGNSNNNGGDVKLNGTNQQLEGDINVDKISTLEINLTKSNYKGSINTENTAKNINLKLDKSSTITLTKDSYITSLEDDDSTYSNINFNGYKLYVNGKAIN